MTSNEIAERTDSSLTLLPPAQAPSASARAMLREHAQMMNDAYQLALGVCGDGRPGTGLMVPKRFQGKPHEGAAAILFGAELGLNPLQAMQRVVPIHGMPSLEARTMVGLLKARGFGFRVVEQSDKVVEVWGWEPNSPKVYGSDPADKLHYGQRINPDAKSRWTIERAIQAGYVPTPSSLDSKRRPDVDDDWVTVTKTWDGKAKKSVLGNMKYITDPQAMLKSKGQAEVSRELAPDVLMGISYSREELESEDERQFHRDHRDASSARAKPVSMDEIFAEEVPIQDAETPAGDVTEDQGTAAPDPQPSPAAQPETATATSNADAKPEPEQVAAPAKKAPAKRAPAKKAEPRDVSKLRAPLEKRLFTLLGDAGLNSDNDRDGRLAVYRAILDRPDIDSTNDLTDVDVSTVCDQLYKWQTAGVLDNEIGGILSDAAREAEETSAAPAADPTSEGTE